MIRYLYCASCAIYSQREIEKFRAQENSGYTSRVRHGKVKAPGGDLDYYKCDHCNRILVPGLPVAAVSYWKGQLPEPERWEHEYLDEFDEANTAHNIQQWEALVNHFKRINEKLKTNL